MNITAIVIGKTIYLVLKIFRHTGATLPGFVIEKIFPQFLPSMLGQLTNGVIIITGTNGKTTTTKMLTSIVSSHQNVLTNSTGSNFTRGIISSITKNCRLSGKLPYDIAILELDEAYAAKFVNIFSPRGVIVLNILRDQLDRFAEIDKTAKLVKSVVEKSTGFVILNKDDQRVEAMANNVKAQVYYYGVGQNLRYIFKNDDEQCSQIKQKKDNVRALVKLYEIEEHSIIVKIKNKLKKFNIRVKGTYNAQNTTAAICAAVVLGINNMDIEQAISSMKPAFGRGEEINIGEKKINLQLVKNPAGFRQVLLSNKDTSNSTTLIAINDDYADGRDVSWLWDVLFYEYIKSKDIIVSGSRATDMALRLKYDDINVTDIDSNLTNALNKSLDSTPIKSTLLIYATYTAMLKLRSQISKITEVDKI